MSLKWHSLKSCAILKSVRADKDTAMCKRLSSLDDKWFDVTGNLVNWGCLEGSLGLKIE
jgi:hypothetical protein